MLQPFFLSYILIFLPSFIHDSVSSYLLRSCKILLQLFYFFFAHLLWLCFLISPAMLSTLPGHVAAAQWDYVFFACLFLLLSVASARFETCRLSLDVSKWKMDSEVEKINLIVCAYVVYCGVYCYLGDRSGHCAIRCCERTLWKMFPMQNSCDEKLILKRKR